MDKVELEIIEFLNKGDVNFDTKKKAINANNLNQMQTNTNDALNDIQDNMLFFSEDTTLNDLVVKSNLLGNNSKINSSEIAIIKNDEVTTLDEYLDNINVYSKDEKIIGKDDDGNFVYRKKFEFSVSSINKDSSFDMNIPNVDKFQKLETYYSVNNAFVPLPFSSGTGATLSSRIEIPSTSTNRVKLYGTANYGDAGTFKITVEYTKRSS